MTSVARMMPSGSEWRQPYTLSNFDLVTESFTLMAGNRRVPEACISYKRFTPVVVSSETPTSCLAILVQRSGCTGRPSLMICRTILNSGFSVVDGSGSVLSLAYAASALTPSWMSRVASPPSSTMMFGPSEPGQVRACSVHHQYSSRVSPFQANTGHVSRAMAAAAWSWVEKMLHEHQRTSAPRAERVSISTAVWIVMCREPMMRAPFSGWLWPNSVRHAMSPGHSASAISISRRPKSASAMSLTLYWRPVAEVSNVGFDMVAGDCQHRES
mmetsp:Transcript_35261/g.104293  ORF Transcript_35261/g.104293 Transcript_35261/m.104293 type:complete len:271 (-) Transcript_35261:18-830(-)